MRTIVKRYAKMYCPVGCGIRIFVLALASGLISLLVFVAANVMLPLCLWYALDESLSVTS